MRTPLLLLLLLLLLLHSQHRARAECPRCLVGTCPSANATACECTTATLAGPFCGGCTDATQLGGPTCSTVQPPHITPLTLVPPPDTYAFADDITATRVSLFVGSSVNASVYAYALLDGSVTDPSSPTSSVSASPGSLFGSVLAASDLLLAVGAPAGDLTSPGGFVRLYALDPNTPGVIGALVGVLDPSQAYFGGGGVSDPGLRFGASLALSSELGLLAVGAPAHNASGPPGPPLSPSAGSVVVLGSSTQGTGPYTAGSWDPPNVAASPVLRSPNLPSPGGAFGASAAWILSVGRSILLVGEPRDGVDAAAGAAGSVHSFFASGALASVTPSSFSQLAYINVWTPGTYTSGCASVAAGGPGSGTRTGARLVSHAVAGTVAVGAPGLATVCVFRSNVDPSVSTMSTLTQVAEVGVPAGAPGDAADSFGAAALALRASTLVVGAPSASAEAAPAATAAGMAWVFLIQGAEDYSDDGAAQLPLPGSVIEGLAPPSSHAPGAAFGSSVAAIDDTSSTFFVGAPALSGPNGTAGVGAVVAVTSRYCPAGQLVGGSGECELCGPGTASNTVNFATTCPICELGMYSEVAMGSKQCLPCPPGTASRIRGTSTIDGCVACAPGHYINATGAAECMLCPSTTYGPTEGLTVCLPCVEGMDCRTLGVSEPRALPGWWRDSSSSDLVFKQCQEPVLRCAGGNTCAESWDNPPTCSDCASGYFLKQDYLEEATCERCPRYIYLYVLGVLVIVMGVSITLVKLARSATVFMTSIGVGLNFIQIAAVLSTFDAGWPQQTQRSLNYLTLFNLNLELFSVECIRATGLSVAGKLMVKLGLPFLFLLVFLVMYITVKVFYKCRLSSVASGSRSAGSNNVSSGAHSVSVASTAQFRSRSILKNAKTWEWAVINAALAMLNLIYISITLTCMEVFDCDDEDGDGTYQMRAQPDVECYSSRWRTLRNYAVLGGLLYGAGIPIMFFGLLRARSHKLHHRSTVLQYGLLYRKFTKYAYLWELVIILRKIMVVGVKLFSSQLSEVSRMQLVLVAMALFFLLQALLKPYQSRRANRLELFTLLCVIGVLMCGLFFQKALGVTPSSAQRFLVGYIVIGIVGIALVVIVFVVGYDFRNARRMKARGMVGAYATEDVQVYPHFFRSGLRMASKNRMVTTTDHFSNLLVAYAYDVYSRTPRPALEVRGASRNRFGNVRSTRFEGAIQVQHDRTENLYVVSALFPYPGNYLLRFAGGVPLDPPSGCCARRLTERAREERERLWHPKRVLMDYALVVTNHAATGPNQAFTPLDQLQPRGGLLFSPVERYLVEGSLFFRVKVPHSHGVVVLQDNGASETHLVKERRGAATVSTFHEDTYSGDVTLVQGRATVIAFMREETLEAAMSSSRHSRRGQARRSHELDDVQILEYEVVAEDAGVQSPSGGTVDLRRRSKHRPSVTNRGDPTPQRTAPVAYNFDQDGGGGDAAAAAAAGGGEFDDIALAAYYDEFSSST